MFTTQFSSVHRTPVLPAADFISPNPKRSGFIFSSSDLEKLPNYATTPILNYQPQFPISLPSPIIINQPILEELNSNSEFSTTTPSGQDNLNDAMKCKVLDGYGKSYEFSQLLDRKSPTVVIFIRNFRCAFCQSYIQNLSTIVNEREEYGSIKSAGIKVVIIGLGSHSMILKYGALFKCPYPIYTDASESNELYGALGMSKRSSESGPESNKGDYLDTMSNLELFRYGVKNSLRLPALKSCGDLKQLGGEFIFEPVPTFNSARIPLKLNAFEVKALTNFSLEPSPLYAAKPLVTKSARVNLSFDRSSSFFSPAEQVFLPIPIVTGLPVTKNTVDIHCKFVHRMSFTRDHSSLYELFGQAGIRLTSNPKKTLAWL
ncbi:uncharacterized protein MELLADRAFT_93731 [Melampsora larici-populina 98AG31]|uniref:Uncharacterized protein n=1 Tax=Melampsora larici-populina (strain 98AG31 / pathotype 3-4-7) TaxID=747676 RepID=F4S524_MELLP|nr:uncharacterized protein MELLADRAFT_93731 [Melampsora larici-populina 98AG31]EGG00244.1 hypothetical protein MELLADRAFT_93731 [Melampsora larici-populina 98AG31]